VRAKPVPFTGIPFQPKLPHQRTIPEPFAVEERSKAMLAQREEKIKQVLVEERRVGTHWLCCMSATLQ
jgi:targeting protein for Xklp2